MLSSIKRVPFMLHSIKRIPFICYPLLSVSHLYVCYPLLSVPHLCYPPLSVPHLYVILYSACPIYMLSSIQRASYIKREIFLHYTFTA